MSGAKTVHHGIDESTETEALLPTTGNAASKCYVEGTRSKKIWDPTTKTWLIDETVAYVYDFDVDAGAIGDIELGDIPAGTTILDGMIEVIDEVTSAGAATFLLEVTGAADVLADAILGTNGQEGYLDIVPAGTAATAITVAAETALVMTIATAVLTAGKFIVYLRCLRRLT